MVTCLLLSVFTEGRCCRATCCNWRVNDVCDLMKLKQNPQSVSPGVKFLNFSACVCGGVTLKITVVGGGLRERDFQILVSFVK